MIISSINLCIYSRPEKSVSFPLILGKAKKRLMPSYEGNRKEQQTETNATGAAAAAGIITETEKGDKNHTGSRKQPVSTISL
jgi:hypothetical protein